jgi:hypothetical protein
MTELTYQHKKSLGETRHMVDTDTFFDDVIPSVVTEAIQAVAEELSPLPPVHVPLRKDEHAVYGWPADGVAEKIRHDGGSIRFGWRMREWPGILLTAEPHAVWVDPEGTLIDITADLPDGDTSLFVPIPDDTGPFDFDRPPPTRYRVLYAVPDCSAAVAERIAGMKPTQRDYEDRRARKAGKTLEEWILDKFHHDPMPDRIAAFIEACAAFDAKLLTLPSLLETSPNTPDVTADVEEPFDETELAADDVGEWSKERDKYRQAIPRTMPRDR